MIGTFLKTGLRVAAVLLLLPAALPADVVILKEGGDKIPGRVTDKKDFIEVETEQGLRTYLKDEIDRIVTSPQEFVGDSDRFYEEAKQDYLMAQKISSPAVREVFRDQRGTDPALYDLATAAMLFLARSEPSGASAAALQKSIRLTAPCAMCGGGGWLRCTNCHGQKNVHVICKACNGTGLAPVTKCTACSGTGFNDCPTCEPLRKPPALADICDAAPCPTCEDRGLVFRRVSIPCRSCMGLGKKLTPKADPSRILAEWP